MAVYGLGSPDDGVAQLGLAAHDQPHHRPRKPAGRLKSFDFWREAEKFEDDEVEDPPPTPTSMQGPGEDVSLLREARLTDADDGPVSARDDESEIDWCMSTPTLKLPAAS